MQEVISQKLGRLTLVIDSLPSVLKSMAAEIETLGAKVRSRELEKEDSRERMLDARLGALEQRFDSVEFAILVSGSPRATDPLNKRVLLTYMNKLIHVESK